MKKTKGITLIALIITIIVMLILVGVSVQVVLDSGIFKQAKKAASETKIVYENEKKIGEKIVINNQEYNSMQEYLESMKGIEDKNITVVSDSQIIKFENTIREANIKNEKEDYSNYEIKGISSEKNGEYITTGYIQGKSGRLEIVGDISNTTFEYKLEKIMLGDETFYCKVNIDGEDYFQALHVIQGDVVKYEEDMLEFIDAEVSNEANTGKWIDIEGDCWSGGKAKYICITEDNGQVGIESLQYYGCNFVLNWGQVKKSFMPVRWQLYDKNGERLFGHIGPFDRIDGKTNEVYRTCLCDEDLPMDVYSLVIEMQYLEFYDGWDLGESTIVIDAVEIYRNAIENFDTAREEQ